MRAAGGARRELHEHARHVPVDHQVSGQRALAQPASRLDDHIAAGLLLDEGIDARQQPLPTGEVLHTDAITDAVEIEDVGREVFLPHGGARRLQLLQQPFSPADPDERLGRL